MNIKVLLLLIFSTAFSLQTYGQSGLGALHGRIVNAEQQAISGASVALQGAATGTVTDTDGQFSLTGIAPGTYVLSVSNVGYTAYTQSLRITKSKNVFNCLLLH